MELRELYPSADEARRALSACPSRPALGEAVVWDVGTSSRQTTRPEHWPAMLLSMQASNVGDSSVVIALVLTRQGRVKRVNARFVRKPRA